MNVVKGERRTTDSQGLPGDPEQTWFTVQETRELFCFALVSVDSIDGIHCGKREEGEEPVSKHQIKFECEEGAG